MEALNKFKSTKKQHKKIIEKGQISHLGLFVQVITIVILTYFAIVGLYVIELNLVTQILLSFVLLVMAYNNYDIFKRKGMTPTYLISGVALTIITIVAIFK